MLVEMQIGGLLLDDASEQPVLMLRDTAGHSALPIAIGLAEAGAIACELERIVPPRPMTHDLLCDVISALGGALHQVVIHDLVDDTFYARLIIFRHEERLELDARPSDAIALAMRCGVAIYAAAHVIAQATLTPGHELLAAFLQGRLSPTADPSTLHALLEALEPEDFGTYEM